MKGSLNVKIGLRWLGVTAGVATLVVWLTTGAHTGWTQTKVTEMQVDPITELEYPVTEERFVAGVEVLGGGLLLALALWSGSLVIKPSTNQERRRIP